jgi:hypothetical protein
MRRLILLTVFSLGPYQLPAGAAQTDAEVDLGTTSADSSGNPQVTLDRPALSREASEILVHMTDFIAAAPVFTMIGHGGNEELQQDGQLLEFGAHLTLAIQRPSQANLRIDTRDGANATLILDGETISIYSVKDNMYVYDTTRQPGDINTSLDFLAAQFGIPRQLGFFLSKDFTASLSRVKSGYRVGESIIDGVMCDHLALRNEKLDVQVWIEKGNEPAPRRIVITHKELQAQPSVWVQFTEWDFSPDLSERIFTHSPPQDAERVGFLADMPAKESE